MTDEVDRYAEDRALPGWFPNDGMEYHCQCMCRTRDSHAEGQRLQRELRETARVPKDDCVGCYLGDDGPSIHDFGYGCQYGKGASY